MPDALLKVCSACQIEKPLDDFNHDNSSLDFHGESCKECAGISPPLQKTCDCCNGNKTYEDFFHNRTKRDYHNSICKKCQDEVNKKREGGAGKIGCGLLLLFVVLPAVLVFVFPAVAAGIMALTNPVIIVIAIALAIVWGMFHKG